MVGENQKKWSQKVTKSSNALDLPKGLFTINDPKKIAIILKIASDSSKRRHSGSFQSAMSMLCFYINRSGYKLNPKQKSILEHAKEELRVLYKKDKKIAK